MQTTVLIHAQCDGSKKEVRIAITRSNESARMFTLQDGEKYADIVCDSRLFAVQEVDKEQV